MNINLPRKKTVSFIATGDELVKGETLDTNSQYFAKKLTELGINVKSQHLIIDDQTLIEELITQQLTQNDCIVLCGGLGPTSDDKTRFAVSHAVNQQLVFNQEQWKFICDRLQRFGIKVHESNKQQAFFPEQAEILPNPNGTAAGCKLQLDDKFIFMLPGPPRECRPMFDEYVISSLINNGFVNQHQAQLYWKLIGVIEADVAATVDSLVKEYGVVTSYRLNYPYLDVKVIHNLSDKAKITELFGLINDAVKDKLVATKRMNSLELLNKYLNKYPDRIYIEDNLTKGEFHRIFGEHEKLSYTYEKILSENDLKLVSSGLDEFHAGPPNLGATNLYCTLSTKDISFSQNLTIPYRSNEVVSYGVHFMAYCMCKMLEKLGFSAE